MRKTPLWATFKALIKGCCTPNSITVSGKSQGFREMIRSGSMALNSFSMAAIKVSVAFSKAALCTVSTTTIAELSLGIALRRLPPSILETRNP